MGTVIACSGLLVILFYCLVILRYGNALRGYKDKIPPDIPEISFKVSVVVPIRNEINNLPDIINDLSAQYYPAGNYEVVLVNDHSDDGSEEYLIEVCRKKENFRIVSLDGHASGKKEAISLGCSVARYGWIIQTDADCRLPKQFIRGHATLAANGKSDLIAGPVLIIPGRSIWSKLESVEMMSLTGTGMASFLMGRPVMCSGANLSYSSSFYEEVKEDLLSVPSPSGDDMFLMVQAKRHQKSMTYLVSPNHIVSTAPAGSIGLFFRQRVRWGSKARHYTDRGLLSLSLLVWTANAIVLFYAVAGLFQPVFIPVFILSWVIKSFTEFILLYHTASIFRCSQLLYIFPLAALFYYFYITVAGALSMAGRFSWKGRAYGMRRNG
jgi:poly-beta-1,6-N-acetyl-D-glucosamine synthase